MKKTDFRVEVRNFNTKSIEYVYFDTEKEAKSYCIARSEYYLKTFDSYEDRDDHNILYQIQYYDRFDGYVPNYSIAINGTAFSE